MKSRSSKAGQFDKLLSMFPGEMRTPLVEFNKGISRIRADYIVFVARKGIRLHDLLVFCGGQQASNQTYSDHILDQDISMLKGKNVALVDDTMILGSTIFRTKEALNSAGVAGIETHILCMENNAVREAVEPDFVYAELNTEAMLTFCSSEVAAFAAYGLPYLTDFPISTIKRMGVRQLDHFLSSVEWIAHTTTNPFQRRAGACGHTFLPSLEVLSRIERALGVGPDDLFEIIKVRMFAVSAGPKFYYCRFVPMMTLKPQTKQSTDQLLRRILEYVEADQSIIEDHFINHVSRTRLLQYVLALWLFQIFCDDMVTFTGNRKLPFIDEDETARHFGSWSLPTIRKAITKFAASHNTAIFSDQDTKEITIPSELRQVMKNDASNFVDARRKRKRTGKERLEIFPNMLRIFVEFYKNVELPAREEFRAEIRRGFVDLSKLKLVDRLKYGFSWDTITEHIIGTDISQQEKRKYSVLLDCLVDTGVAVPILCDRNGVVFRAYRHGEDVLFGEQEYALCYEALRGFLFGGNTQSAPRIETEKLFSMLVKVGTKLQFLEEIHGTTGSGDWARVGYHLHGTVVYFEPTNHGLVPEGVDSFLSSYLRSRDVIRRSKDGQYEIGVKPDAAYKREGAELFAFQLGFLLGSIFRRNDQGGTGSLSTNELILLATCNNVSSAVAAIAAELYLFVRRFFRNVVAKLEGVVWDDAESLNAVLETLKRDESYTAINSALMKYSGFVSGRVEQVKTETVSRITESAKSPIEVEAWKMYVGQLDVQITEQQKDQLEYVLKSRLGSTLVDIATGVFTAELAIASAMTLVDKEDKSYLYRQTCKKVQRFFGDLAENGALPGNSFNLHKRVVQVAGAGEVITKYKNAADSACGHLRGMAKQVSTISLDALKAVFDLGRRNTTVNFSRFVWYDVVNSTGEKGGLKGSERDEHISNVATFRDTVVGVVRELQAEAFKRGCLIKGRTGMEEDDDDEKKLFYSGPNSDHFAKLTANRLCEVAVRCGVQIRVTVLHAGFAGTVPYQVVGNSNIEGVQFHEHFSRISMKLKEIGNSEYFNMEESGRRGSILWLGSKFHRDSYKHPKLPTFELIKSRGVTTNIAGAYFETPFSAFVVGTRITPTKS